MKVSLGQHFCLSLYPGSSIDTQRSDPIVLKPGGLAYNTTIIYAYRRSRRPSNPIPQSSTGKARTWRADRQKTGLILELGLPAQSSHLSWRLQETAGSYDEKRRNGKFNVGCRGKRETDLPQCNGPDPDRLDIIQ